MRSASLAALALLFIVGCGGGEHTPPPFSVVDGDEVRRAVVAYRGQVVMLNVWATWCEPCRKEFPAIVSLDSIYRNRGLRVLTVSVDEPEDVGEKVRPFIRRMRAQFPVWIKGPGDPMRFMARVDSALTGALPQTIIYDRNGNRAHVLTGEQTLISLRSIIDPLISRGSRLD